MPLVVPAAIGLSSRKQRTAFGLGILEMPKQHIRVRRLEIEARKLLLGLAEDVGIGDLLFPITAVEVQIEDRIDTWTYMASRSSP